MDAKSRRLAGNDVNIRGVHLMGLTKNGIEFHSVSPIKDRVLPIDRRSISTCSSVYFMGRFIPMRTEHDKSERDNPPRCVCMGLLEITQTCQPLQTEP